MAGYHYRFLGIFMNMGHEMQNKYDQYRSGQPASGLNENTLADVWLGNRGALMGLDVSFFGSSPGTLRRLWRHNILLQWP